jgi:hypothetical protein
MIVLALEARSIKTRLGLAWATPGDAWRTTIGEVAFTLSTRQRLHCRRSNPVWKDPKGGLRARESAGLQSK